MALNSPIQAPWGSHTPVPWLRALPSPAQSCQSVPVVLQGSGSPATPQQGQTLACPHSHRGSWGCSSCLPGLPCSLSKGSGMRPGCEAHRDPLMSPGTWLQAAASAVALPNACVSPLTWGGFILLFPPQRKSSQSRDLKQFIYNNVLSPSYFPFMELCIVIFHLKADLNKAILLSNLQRI